MYRQEKLLAGALLLLVSLSNPAGATTVRFRPGVTYRVGTAPRAVVAADFNGDGKQDLAGVNAGNAGAGDDGSVSILLGNDDGTFQSASNIPAGKNPVSIAVGDFNGDGRPDLAVGDAGDGGSISILLGNGDGTFERAESVGLEGAAFSLAVGDFDGDLRTDAGAARKWRRHFSANRKSFTGFFITFCHLFLPTHFNSLFQFTFQFTIPPKVHNGSQTLTVNHWEPAVHPRTGSLDCTITPAYPVSGAPVIGQRTCSTAAFLRSAYAPC